MDLDMKQGWERNLNYACGMCLRPNVKKSEQLSIVHRLIRASAYFPSLHKFSQVSFDPLNRGLSGYFRYTNVER
jgi:hypothetical protein